MGHGVMGHVARILIGAVAAGWFAFTFAQAVAWLGTFWTATGPGAVLAGAAAAFCWTFVVFAIWALGELIARDVL